MFLMMAILKLLHGKSPCHFCFWRHGASWTLKAKGKKKQSERFSTPWITEHLCHRSDCVPVRLCGLTDTCGYVYWVWFFPFHTFLLRLSEDINTTVIHRRASVWWSHMFFHRSCCTDSHMNQSPLIITSCGGNVNKCRHMKVCTGDRFVESTHMSSLPEWNDKLFHL